MTEPLKVWEEPVRGVHSDLAVLALPGDERFRRGFRGELAPPPVHYLTGLRPTEATQGRCVFTMPVSPWFRIGVGTVPLGMLAFLADSPLGGVAITGLGPGQIVSTSELALQAVRPVTPAAGTLVAEAELAHLGRLLAISGGRVLDAEGRLLATMSTRCFVISLPLPDDHPPPQTTPVDDTPSPWQRPLPDTDLLLRPDQLESMSGLEILEAAVAGDARIPAPPLYYLVGFRPVEVRAGEMTWSMPATAWLSAGAPFMYGGAIALFAECVLTFTASTVLPLGQLPFTLDLQVRFLRPVPLEGELTAHATVLHAGKAMVVAQTRVTDGQGRTLALADASCAVVPLDVAHLPLEDAMADRVAGRRLHQQIARDG